MFTKKEFIILEILDSEHRWWYALDVVRASEGRLSSGSIYAYMALLVSKKLIVSRQENDEEYHGRGMRRYLYKITEGGRRVKREHGAAQETDSDLLPEPA